VSRPVARRPVARRPRSLRSAAAFVDRAGIALVFPRDDVVLPSLWEAVAGSRTVEWVEEHEDGSKHFTPEMDRVWSWKDELAAERLCCAGKHVRGWQSLVSLSLLPSLYALTGRRGRPDDFREPGQFSPLELDIAEAVLELGASSGPDIRKQIASHDTARVNRAIDSLQRRLVLTKAGVIEQEHGWPAGTFDLTARRYALGRLPAPHDARRALARAALDAAGELSAADLGAVFGWRRAEAGETLESLAVACVERDGYRLWLS
jgi:hypothetical protein